MKDYHRFLECIIHIAQFRALFPKKTFYSHFKFNKHPIILKFIIIIIIIHYYLRKFIVFDMDIKKMTGSPGQTRPLM